MRSKWQFMITMALILLCTGCNGQKQAANPKPTESPSSGPVSREVLTFRITWKTYSGRGEAIKKIVNTYNQTGNSAYEIQMMDGDEDLDTIESLLESKDSADIYMLPYRFTQYLGYKKKLEDLTADFVDEEPLFYEKMWQLGVVEDKVYGIPWLGHSMGLIYNKNLLDKAGIDPTKIDNLDKLVAACETIEAKTDAKGIGLVGADQNDVSWMVNQFVYGFSGKLVNEDGSKVMINSPQAKKAIEFYKNDLGAHAQDTWRTDTGVEVMNYFREGKIAFEIQGPWGITDIWKIGNPFEVGVIPLQNLSLYAEIGPMMLTMRTKLSHQERSAAIDFMRYLISGPAQEMIMDGEYSPEHDAYYPFRLPVRKDMEDNRVFEAYPEFLVFLKEFNQPSIDVPVPLWQKIKDKYYAPGLHKVMMGELSIEDFLNEMEDEGNKILTDDKEGL